jgi:ADP-ribose pyrophosphatase YjhB (NUDIX family)/predicted enzyme related to lactoylglutathione lyase
MISAIHHVQLTVPPGELDAALGFYRDVLGLPLSPHRPAEWGPTGYWFIVGDRELHIGTEDGVDRRATRAHLAFKVDDANAYREKLKSLGLFKCEEPLIAGYDRFHAHDPFGNTLEFIEPRTNRLLVDRPPMPLVHLSVALLHRGRVLLVREGKPHMKDKWNLPGGHAERGEFAVDGAMRELEEETGLADCWPVGVLGVFSTSYSIRLIVIARTGDDPKPIAGDEVLESRFFTIDEADALPDAAFINPTMFREILARLRAGVCHPLDLVATIKEGTR